MTEDEPMNAVGPPKRPGRPAGPSRTRERILASARELFGHNGIAKTSIRAIAADAGVDPALVHHYFGTKEMLFTAAVDIPFDPAIVIDTLRATPVDQLGRTIPSLVLPLWESELGTRLKATLRAAIAGDQVAIFSYFLRDVVLTPPPRRSAGSRTDPGRIRGHPDPGCHHGQAHFRAPAVRDAAHRSDHRHGGAEPAALPHR